MSETLLLILGETPGDPIRWGVLDGARLIENGLASSADDISSISDDPDQFERIVALLPGEQVAARRMPSAPKGAAKALAAARFLMEDELGESGENLHVVVSQGEAGHRVVAVKTAIVEEWLQAFKESGIEPDVLSADYLSLPSTPETATVISESERVVVAYAGTGFAIEASMFASLGEGLFATSPQRVDVLGAAEVKQSLPNEAGMNWLGAIDEARLLTLYGAMESASAPNLLQGRFSRRRSISFDFKPWRRAAAIAAAVAVASVLSIVADGVRAGGEAARWRELAKEVHTQAFPEAAESDPTSYARNILNEGGDARFLTLSTRFADVLAENEEVQLDRVRFNAARGEYVVSLQSQSDSAIEAFRAALLDYGVDAVDNGGYRRSEGVWTGELTARLQ